MGMITAHSGCDGTMDNSLGFLTYALSSEADCLEVDVRRNDFGDLILSHDGEEMECVLLQDAFDLLREVPGKKMNCDLKHSGLERPVYRLAVERGVENRLIYSGDVDQNLLISNENGTMLPGVEIYLNLEGIYPGLYDELENLSFPALKPDQFRQSMKEAARCHAKVINMEYRLITDETLQLLEEYGLGCSAWTVNDPAALKNFIKKDIANITTRHVREALAIRRELECVEAAS